MNSKLQADMIVDYQKPTIDLLQITPEQGFAGSNFDNGWLSADDSADQGLWD